jgi:hypothetical protein
MPTNRETKLQTLTVGQWRPVKGTLRRRLDDGRVRASPVDTRGSLTAASEASQTACPLIDAHKVSLMIFPLALNLVQPVVVLWPQVHVLGMARC